MKYDGVTVERAFGTGEMGVQRRSIRDVLFFFNVERLPQEG